MNVYVLGVAMHPGSASIDDKRLEEIVHDTARAALDDAGITRADIDHVTLGGCDELDGRGITSMLMAAPAGAYLRDEMRVTDSGLMALCMGALRVATGRFDCGLVVSWNQTSIGSVEEVTRMRAEPFTLRPMGLNRAVTDGLFAQAVARGTGTTEAEVDARVQRRMTAAESNPRRASSRGRHTDAGQPSGYVAYPLSGRQRAPVTDGAAALVLVSEQWLAAHPQARPIARIGGAAWGVDSYRLDGERLGSLAVYKKAFADALARAGLDSLAELDAVELEAQDGWYDAAFDKALSAPPQVALSPSGGAWAQNPYFCTGLINAVEAVLQVSGRAGAVQVKDARRVAAHGTHGFAQQGHAVVIMERAAA
ncbi:thiolase C-terminal domain-containing protein [Variovorax sp. IB41]|uniref:thiolase C-terminal domain-containing protein n=1 Tax=Variovorax sp. IB41 TaxID=2779370 RepID=UPI0018E8BD8C|nr:thiolase family protein [Variovorax sp. IB41]MBJ2154292.1 thiolase family protein [Variovorax sp. IB41]